jgi:hypothetical protein
MFKDDIVVCTLFGTPARQHQPQINLLKFKKCSAGPNSITLRSIDLHFAEVT